jgi:hypothetical protein
VQVPKDGSVPKELQCALTKDLLREAVVLPCCVSNVSLAPVNERILETSACPVCMQVP